MDEKVLNCQSPSREGEFLEVQHQQKQNKYQIYQISGQHILNSYWYTITLRKPRIIQTGHSVRTIALSPDGKYIASAGSGDYTIKIWDPITGKQVGTGMKGHEDWIHSINYSKCGKFIISGSYDNTIRQWDTLTQQQIGEPMSGDQKFVLGVQYSPDQIYIVSCSYDKTIRLWESKTGKEQIDKRIYHSYPIWCLSLSPIQSYVVFGDSEGIVEIWDYKKHQKMVHSQQCHSTLINSIQYSNDGKLIVSGSNDKTIKLWDWMSKKIIRSFLNHTYYVQSVSFSPDTRYIISGENDYQNRICKVLLWDRLTGKQIGQAVTQHKGSVGFTLFSLDGKFIINGGVKQIKIMLAKLN